MRLTKTEATEACPSGSPLAARRSSARRYASATAVYCSSEKISVALTFAPAAITSSSAAAPAGVAGILIMALGRSRAFHRRSASDTVVSRSSAMSGLTSRLTKPSPPRDSSHSGRKSAQASRTSLSVSAS